MSTLKIVELTGAGNFIVPQGVYFLEWAEAVGGSGGGGRGIGLGNGGGGAPGAAAARLNRFAVSPGQTFAYSQGAAGVGAPGTGNGTAGGDTSFGSILLAKGSLQGNNISTAAKAGPLASDCIGDVKVGGNASLAVSGAGGNGCTGGAGPTLSGALMITPGAGGLSGVDNAGAGNGNGGGNGQPDGGGGGGGRNLNPLTGGNGVVGRLWVAYFLPEVWS